MQALETESRESGEGTPLMTKNGTKSSRAQTVMRIAAVLGLAAVLICVAVWTRSPGANTQHVLGTKLALIESVEVEEDLSVCGAKNVGLNKPTDQMVQYSSGLSKYAVDGKPSTCSYSGSGTHPWLYVDVGAQASAVCGVRIVQNSGWVTYMRKFLVFVTDRKPTKGKSFVVKKSEVCNTYNGASFTIRSMKCKNPIKGRYVGVMNLGNVWMGICEFEVFSTHKLTEITLPAKCNKASLVSQKQPTGQISTYSIYSSARAVDGKLKSTQLGQGSCIHTGWANKPWWYVDIGGGETVCSVKIWNMATSQNRLTQFKIFVTNRKPVVGRAFVLDASEVCYDYKSNAVFSVKAFKCKKAMMGRYVGVELTKTNYLSLCEVQVFGQKTPPPMPVACIPGGPLRTGKTKNFDNFGTLSLPATGVLYGFTMEYLSGKLYFYPGKCVSGRWGFSFPGAGKLGYQVFVTDSKKNLLFPKKNTVGLTIEKRNKCYRFKYGPLALVNKNWIDGQTLKVVFEPPLNVRRGQKLRFYTGHNLWRPKLAVEDHGETCATVKMNYKKKKCPPGEYFDNVRLHYCVLCPKNFYCPGSNLVVPCPKGTFQSSRGQAKCIKQAQSDACVLGKNFKFMGNPCIISGDPHQTSLFNGGGMDFMGTKPNTNQYYYVTKCSNTPTGAIPFNILGTHAGGRISGFDYVTLELFDNGNVRHLVFLNPGKYGYIANAAKGTSTLMPNTMASLPSVLRFGAKSRFQGKTVISGGSLSFSLFVDNKAVTTIYMRNQWLYQGGRYRGQYVQISPIKVFQCHACGICGDFKKAGFFLPQCNGGYISISRGYHAQAFSSTGLSWRKGACKQKDVPQTPKNPCPKNDPNYKIAKQECDKQKQLYASTCTANLIKQCQALDKSCATDVCLLGAKNAARNAKGIYGHALGVLKSTKGKMERDFGYSRTNKAKSAVALVGSGGEFAPYSAASGMQNGQAGKKQGVREVVEYRRVLSCGKKAVTVGTLTGFDMSVGFGKTASVGVSTKGVDKVSGELSVGTWDTSMVFGASGGFIGSCYSGSNLRAFSMGVSKKEVATWKQGDSVVVSKSLKMKCTQPLQIFSVLSKISVQRGLKVALFSSVTAAGGTATASVEFFSRSAKNVVDMGASVVVFCPSAVEQSSKLSARYLQVGSATLTSIFPSPNGGERSQVIHVGLNPRMACASPSVVVGFIGIDITNGYQLSLDVEEKSVTPDGFDVQVKAWRDTDVDSLTFGYLVICEM